MLSLHYLTDNIEFPSPKDALADPNGLLAVGGDLRPERLMNAYYNGIFPWFNVGEPILWWSPTPRAVFIPTHPFGSKSLRKWLKKAPWTFTINRAFNQVIHACAKVREIDGTWITPDIQNAYKLMHKLGKAHSFEVWEQDELIGGLYGISVGKVFCGESMFHTKTNASKAAFAMLNQHCVLNDYNLIDGQLVNPHLLSLGAKVISRDIFLNHLYQHRDSVKPAHIWQAREVFFDR